MDTQFQICLNFKLKNESVNTKSDSTKDRMSEHISNVFIVQLQKEISQPKST